jgi:long-chain acyl-CoA synthetase
MESDRMDAAANVWAAARRHPDRLALVSDPDRADSPALTFAELVTAANQISHAFGALGLREGDRVAVVLPNVWELFALQLATAQSGCHFVPISRHLTASETAVILDSSQARMVVTSDALAPMVGAAAEIAAIDRDLLFSAGSDGELRAFADEWRDRPPTPPARRRAGAMLFYSSGTTGRPKGILRPLPQHSPEAEVAVVEPTWRLLGLSREPGRHLVVAPLYHAAPNVVATGALHRGHTVLLGGNASFAAADFLRLVQQHRVTETFMVPTMLHRLQQLPDEDRARWRTDSLRSLVHAGAPCPTHVKRAIIEWLGPILAEYYGSTETSIATAIDSQEWLRAPGSVGRARAGCELRIVAPDGRPCPVGEEGLVYIRGGRPFSYLTDSGNAGAAETPVNGEGFFAPGDVGVLDEAGRLFLRDRRTDMILSGGVNVYPAEVESVLMEHPAVADAVVFGVPDEEWGQSVTALVLPRPGHRGPELGPQLRQHCTSRLARYKRPRVIELVEESPRMANGKVNRGRARAGYLSSHSGREEPRATRTSR